MAESTSFHLISVIIPVYNGEKYLAETLQSILAQTYRPFEIIVVDDGSTDRSAAIARSFPDVHCHSQTNQGHGAARNIGIDKARGELLAFCDADDLWMVDKLESQVALLNENPSAGFALGRMKILLDPGAVWPPSWNEAHYASDPAAYIPSALLARRHIFDIVGLFDPQYRIGNDSDWFFRARDAGIKWVTVDKVVLFRRVHTENLSHDTAGTNRELLHLVRASIQRRKANDKS